MAQYDRQNYKNLNNKKREKDQIKQTSGDTSSKVNYTQTRSTPTAPKYNDTAAPTSSAPSSAYYLDQIVNREDFSLDLNNDALYEQMRRDYINQGRMAMEGTMGQAAALTGGYGNSYAQTVGQQAYNQHLGALNDAIPDLYQMAYERYQNEGNKLYDLYSLYKGEERQAIEDQRYQDELDYRDSRDAEDDRRYQEELAYRDSRDKVEDSRYQDELDYRDKRDAEEDRRYQEEIDYRDRRDEVEDSRYQGELEYRERRDAEEDSRYQDEVDYRDWRDEVEDRRYKDEIDYRDSRDEVEDSRYEDELDYRDSRDEVEDQRYDKEEERWFMANGFVKDENGEWYLPEVPVSAEDKDSWTWTGATDENGNRIFIKDGKEYAFGSGVNPNTGTANPDAANGVMPNGYQPDNIGGEPVTMSDYTYDGHSLWECDGNYYLWSDKDNQYLRVDVEDETNPLEDPDYKPSHDSYLDTDEKDPMDVVAPGYNPGPYSSQNPHKVLGAGNTPTRGHSDLADPKTDEWLRYVFTENVRGGGNAGKFGVHTKKDVL